MPPRIHLPFDVLLVLHWQEKLHHCTGTLPPSPHIQTHTLVTPPPPPFYPPPCYPSLLPQLWCITPAPYSTYPPPPPLVQPQPQLQPSNSNLLLCSPLLRHPVQCSSGPPSPNLPTFSFILLLYAFLCPIYPILHSFALLCALHSSSGIQSIALLHHPHQTS